MPRDIELEHLIDAVPAVVTSRPPQEVAAFYYNAVEKLLSRGQRGAASLVCMTVAQALFQQGEVFLAIDFAAAGDEAASPESSTLASAEPGGFFCPEHLSSFKVPGGTCLRCVERKQKAASVDNIIILGDSRDALTTAGLDPDQSLPKAAEFLQEGAKLAEQGPAERAVAVFKAAWILSAIQGDRKTEYHALESWGRAARKLGDWSQAASAFGRLPGYTTMGVGWRHLQIARSLQGGGREQLRDAGDKFLLAAKDFLRTGALELYRAALEESVQVYEQLRTKCSQSTD